MLFTVMQQVVRNRELKRPNKCSTFRSKKLRWLSHTGSMTKLPARKFPTVQCVGFSTLQAYKYAGCMRRTRVISTAIQRLQPLVQEYTPRLTLTATATLRPPTSLPQTTIGLLTPSLHSQAPGNAHVSHEPSYRAKDVKALQHQLSCYKDVENSLSCGFLGKLRKMELYRVRNILVYVQIKDDKVVATPKERCIQRIVVLRATR